MQTIATIDQYGAFPLVRSTLLALAAYGVIQVLAQDLGVKTGKAQAEFVRMEPVFSILMLAGAFAVTDSLFLSLCATFFYYFMKHYVSQGVTAPICFEEV